MVKIEQSENFHPRRKMTPSVKMAAFSKTPYIKVTRVRKFSDS